MSNTSQEWKIKRKLLIFCGHVLVSLGVIGIFVPLMPTTIFLILAAACYAKSSHEFYDWLIHHPVLGKYIKSYLEGRGMPMKAKISATITIVLVMSLSAFLVNKTFVWIILGVIMVSVLTYIWSLKTADPEDCTL